MLLPLLFLLLIALPLPFLLAWSRRERTAAASTLRPDPSHEPPPDAAIFQPPAFNTPLAAATAHLLRLVAIPSVSSMSNRAVLDYAADVLHRLGWSTLRQPYTGADGVEKANLLAAPPGQDVEDPQADFAILCHTDTVPFDPAWSEALAPAIRDGNLHGCGACDVKGFLAAVLAALGAVHTAGGAFRPGLRLALTADEEIGCLGTHRLLAAGMMQARSVLIGEPTSLHPARAGKGYCLAEVHVHGASAHSAHPTHGRSAIFDASRLLLELEALAAELAASPTGDRTLFDPPYTTLNVGTIAGGTAKNVIPAECSFLLEWRPLPGGPASALPQAFSARIAALTQAYPELRCEVLVLRETSGFETCADAPLVSTLADLSNREPIAIPFGSEASAFAAARLANPSAPTPAEIVVWGPGDIRTAHSPREFMPLDELASAVEILATLLGG